MLVAATSIALHRALEAFPNRAWVIGAGAAVVLATNLLVPLPTTTFTTSAASEGALRAVDKLAQPGDTVLSVPADCDPAFVSLQVFHKVPVVGCAGSFAANPWSRLRSLTRSAALTKLRCDRAAYGRLTTPDTSTEPFTAADLAALRTDLGVRFVVIDHAKLGAQCAAVEGALPVLREHRVLGEDARYEVIDLAQPAAG